MSKLFFTSDMHFGHVMLVEKGHRPFSTVEQMNATIIANWNNVVSDEDTVWILGDAIMGQFTDNVHILGQLNGFKILNPGNHDKVHPAYKSKPHRRAAAKELYENYVTISDTLNVTLNVGEMSFDVSHFPYVGDHTSGDRYVDFRPPDEGRWLLHGHVHDTWRLRDRQINVGVDVWNFTPVEFPALQKIMETGSDDDI